MKFYPCIFFCFFFTFLSCVNKNSALLWYENFEGAELDENYWNYDLGDGCPNLCGWGNQELQYYRQSNVSVDNNHLVITAEKEGDAYYSGKITTKNKFEFQYGTIEVRTKLPSGAGTWPAIWMLGSDINEIGWPACGEIDIMEYVGKNPGVVHTSLHTSSSSGNTVNTAIHPMEDPENTFHIYACTWNPNEIVFSIDGNEVYRYAPETKDLNTWPFDKPFFIILNLAIGGTFGGPDIDDDSLPAKFTIDYIKVSSNNP